MKKIKVGMKVGAERWGMSHAHPSIWMTPWSGTVLAKDDVRAWEGRIAMQGKPATKQRVKEHLASLERLGSPVTDEEVPVLWDFGDEKRVYWEKASHLRPYSEDVAKWKKEKEKKLMNW